MNVEIGAEAALFPEKEYINEIFVAVHSVSWIICVLRRFYITKPQYNFFALLFFWVKHVFLFSFVCGKHNYVVVKHFYGSFFLFCNWSTCFYER
jgi:hypothetical protein